MTAPNVNMIAASLRSCSLRGAGGGVGGDQSPLPHLAEASEESEGGVTVILNSEAALPYNWEQHLDMRTGDIYFINWETGVRTTEDPRAPAAVADSNYSSTYCYSDEDDQISDAHSCASHTGIGNYNGDGDNDEGKEDDSDSADSSSLYCASPAQTFAEEDAVSGCSDSQVLVAAGCKNCFTYFMVPKNVGSCPKCGFLLLNLDSNGFV